MMTHGGQIKKVSQLTCQKSTRKKLTTRGQNDKIVGEQGLDHEQGTSSLDRLHVPPPNQQYGQQWNSERVSTNEDP